MTASKQKYVLNLVEIFNRSFSDRPSAVKDKLRKFLSDPGVKSDFAREVIREIQKRTAKGVDKDGVSFPDYSASYKKSLVFKIYGKSAGDVNLKLSGQMLAGMDPDVVSGARVVIHFPSSAQNAKADGHITGNIGAKRDFFGLPIDDEARILKETIVNQSQLSFLSSIDDIAATNQVVTGTIGTQTITVGSTRASIARNLGVDDDDF